MLCCLDQRNTIAAVRTVRRFTRHAADELSEPQEASLKYSGFLLSTAAQDLLRAPATRLRDDDEGQQTTGGTPRTVKMAQDRDDLVYLAKLAEQAERFDEMARRRRGGSITPFVYSSGRRRIDKGGAARERRRSAPPPRTDAKTQVDRRRHGRVHPDDGRNAEITKPSSPPANTRGRRRTRAGRTVTRIPRRLRG